MNSNHLYSYITPTKPSSYDSTQSSESQFIPVSTSSKVNEKLNQKIEDMQQEFDGSAIQSQNSNSISFENSCSKFFFMGQEECSQSAQKYTEKPEISSTIQQSTFQNIEDCENKNYQNFKQSKISKGISKVKYLKQDSNEYKELITKFDQIKSISNYKPTFSKNTNKIIEQLKNNKINTKRTSCSNSNNKLNSILNRKSLKESFRHLLGSQVFDIQNNEYKDLLNLMNRIDQIMMRRTRLFLSELIQSVNGLTIIKMNQIMNLCPPLFNLSLKMNKFQQQDMLIELPNQENSIQMQVWQEQRFADFKQRLYYSEKQQQNNAEQPPYISSKVTQTILDSIKEKNNKLNNEFEEMFQKLQRQEVVQSNISIQSIVQTIKEYFEKRNVSNIFKINIVEYISKNLNTTLIDAESKLNELLNQYPNWLSAVKSHTLGQIIRINLAFNIII